MVTQIRHFLAAAVAYSLSLFCTGLVVAADRYLSLPFQDAAVYLKQGWIYDDKSAHGGIDYFKGSSSPYQSFEIRAAGEGRAIVSDEGSAGVGKFVYIAHPQFDDGGRRIYSVYGHLVDKSWETLGIPYKNLSNFKADVNSGNLTSWKKVKRGDKIGMAGSTGFTVPPGTVHLHFGIHRGGWKLNRADPYDLYKTAPSYPGYASPSASGGSCGTKHNWIECPPRRPSCTNVYLAGSAPPTGYGAAYNVFSPDRELTIEAGSCVAPSAVVRFGNGQPNQVIYRFGYLWKNNQWQQFALSGTPHPGSGEYYLGDGWATIGRNASEAASGTFVTAYICTWINDVWQCGCRDTTCATPYWQLQTFRSSGTVAAGSSALPEAARFDQRDPRPLRRLPPPPPHAERDLTR